MRFILFLFCLVPLSVFSQCKTYSISVKKDTINCTDFNNQKQGKWVIHVEPLRGEQGYEMEGAYIDDKKEGPWRTYSLMGDLLALENYRWGYKNGKSYYYNLFGIVREESWKSIDPKNPYDTIDVPDLNTDKVYRRIIKTDAYTVKNGTWKYYDPQTGLIQRTEEYQFDRLVDPFTGKVLENQVKPPYSMMEKDTAAAKVKPPEVVEYEKKNANKKKIRVRDGVTGVQ